MEGNRLKTWTITVVIFMTIVVACKAQTNTTTAPQTVDDADTRTSLQKGMQPLYDMTNWFLDLVNPNGIVDFLDAAGKIFHSFQGDTDPCMSCMNSTPLMTVHYGFI